MTRSLALLAALALGVSAGAAWAGGSGCSSYGVSTVASADGQSAPSTQIQLPKPKGG